MIISAHHTFYERILPFVTGPVLMLGNQELESGYSNPFPTYKTFDPDGGDYAGDLSDDQTALHDAFRTIVNIGTIEHIWDIHGAFCNVVSMLKIGGVYAGVSPVAGYRNHGIHITGARYIEAFFKSNGFEIIDRWYSDRVREIPDPTDGDSLFWIVARKLSAPGSEFVRPQQVFANGQPQR